MKKQNDTCCDYCRHFGVVNNYMAYCSVYKQNFPAGWKRCKNGFKKDSEKYNGIKNKEQEQKNVKNN